MLRVSAETANTANGINKLLTCSDNNEQLSRSTEFGFDFITEISLRF